MIPADFAVFVAGLQLRSFSAGELLVKGDSHANPAHKGYGLNTDPPKDQWKNIVATVRLLDRLRDELGAPIRFNSVYRSPAYNPTVAGAANSQHLHFNAIDFVVHTQKSGPKDWAAMLRGWRDAGDFKGGLHAYPDKGFVHVDTRGTNTDWE